MKASSLELCAYPIAFSVSFYVPVLSAFWGLLKRFKPNSNLNVSAALANFFSAFFTFLFAFVGTLLGAFTGAMIGQESESGFVRGAAVGAISGAVFSIEVFESSLALWRSDESTFGCFLYLVNVIISLVSGKLVRERIGSAMLNAVQTQMVSSEVRFEDVANLFDTGICKGMTEESMEKLPIITIDSDNNVDESGENVSCSVCLQDFQLEETARSLPQCHHTFHLLCIDKWLLRHSSCPMCRRDL